MANCVGGQKDPAAFDTLKFFQEECQRGVSCHLGVFILVVQSIYLTTQCRLSKYTVQAFPYRTGMARRSND